MNNHPRHLLIAFDRACDETSALITRSDDRENRYILSFFVDEMLELVSRQLVLTESASCYMGGLRLHPTYYDDDAGRVSIQKIDDLYYEGGTIRFERVERYFPTLRRAVSIVDRNYEAASWFNLYLAPSASDGLLKHADDHDLFAIQLMGSKDWTIWNTVGKTDERDQGECIRLTSGDALFVPRGMPHLVKTISPISIHLTWGFDQSMAAKNRSYMLEAGRFGTAFEEREAKASNIGELAGGEHRSFIAAAIGLERLSEELLFRVIDKSLFNSKGPTMSEWLVSDNRYLSLNGQILKLFLKQSSFEWQSIDGLRNLFEDAALYRLLVALIVAKKIEVREQ